jgi:1-acyl-sn-glycerol-3-phosphate acyltransferase
VPRRVEHVPLSYRALTAWARAAVAVFYRGIDVTALERIPRDRPAVLAANHRNALGDVAVIVAKMPDFPRFLASASWWKSAPARLLFRLGGVVPVHRRRDGDPGQNQSSFEECHAALAAGAHVAIFPEGEMHSEPALLPLKTGAARIALGAASEAGVTDVVIVPVGLLYDDVGRFRSDVEVHVGVPIEAADWADAYRTDPAKAVREVTDLLADRLAGVTVNHGSHAERVLVDRAARLAVCEAGAVPDGVYGDGAYARRNALRRAIAETLARCGGEDAAEFRRLAEAVEAHDRELAALGVAPSPGGNPVDDGRASVAERTRLTTELVALSLPAAAGAVANAPVVLLAWLASTRAPDEGWHATTKGVAGTLLCPIVWGAEYAYLSRRTSRPRALALCAAGAAGGMAALGWWERWRRRGRIRERERLGERDPDGVARADATRAAVAALATALAQPGDASIALRI